MIWKPDTCKCVIDCDRPSINGSFVKRCKIHPSPDTTTDVYAHNIQPRFRFNGTQGLLKAALRDQRLGLPSNPAEQAVLNEINALSATKAAEKATT